MSAFILTLIFNVAIVSLFLIATFIGGEMSKNLLCLYNRNVWFFVNTFFSKKIKKFFCAKKGGCLTRPPYIYGNLYRAFKS